LEAVVESSPVTAAGTVLVLALPGGVRVEVADEKQAALAAILVRALTKPC
jgi:predicted phosphoribosyltransferase